MSHQPERKEKTCLNCGAGVYGRFCHVCGQENIVTHQSFWSLAKHFVFDILHFDGKFFHTLGYLFSKPGFVAKQYVQGRRVSYLDPIRMYLFTSAVFFLVFFSVDMLHLNVKDPNQELSPKERQKMVQKLQNKLQKHPGDSALLHNLAILSDTSKPVNPDSLDLEGNSLSFTDSKYKSVRQYDSAQAALPQAERDGWIVRRFTLQSIRINQKYGRSDEIVKIYLETFLHKLPYLLFLSLPFFALILKVLYTRRKNFYYSDHAV
ncbi:MAG TPA: DUF3667 domain-containing protein, partial [Flavisolibacter sp.]|nr:DUF3667 domain-containing protein [Flavisolibacter sp.]